MNTKRLLLIGSGYKAEINDNLLSLIIGFSHPVTVKIPDDIYVSIRGSVIEVNGSDKYLVGQVAADIRNVRPPDPYNGKGIRYNDEIVRVKTKRKIVR